MNDDTCTAPTPAPAFGRDLGGGIRYRRSFAVEPCLRCANGGWPCDCYRGAQPLPPGADERGPT